MLLYLFNTNSKYRNSNNYKNSEKLNLFKISHLFSSSLSYSFSKLMVQNFLCLLEEQEHDKRFPTVPTQQQQSNRIKIF